MCRNTPISWNSEDPTTRARIRGRAITAALARLVKESDEGRFWVDMRSVLSGGTPMGNPKSESMFTKEGEEVGAIIASPDIHNEKPGDMLRHVWTTHTPQFTEDHPLA